MIKKKVITIFYFQGWLKNTINGLINMTNNDILWLEKWYNDRCNGDWEHGSIIEITTIDNPGWSISINLEDTELQSKMFNTVEIERSNSNWLYCFKNNNKLEGRCGALNLHEVLDLFHNWMAINKANINKQINDNRWRG